MKKQWHVHLSLLLLLTFLPVSQTACFKVHTSEKAISKKFTDNFQRSTLGKLWYKQGGSWNIENSALHTEGDQNIPLWLKVNLPKNVRVELTVWSESPAVDAKLEIFGDGLRHQSGYIVIFGGWNNKITTIAKLDEHQKNRVEKHTKWNKDQKYKWTIERTDGKSLRFLVDDQLIIEYIDPDPLFGQKNNKLGFSSWKSKVYYDDLVITPL